MSRSSFLVLGLVGLLAGRAARACPSTAADLAGWVGAAKADFVQMDEKAFGGAAANLREALACAGEPIGPTGAANLHLMEALSAWLGGDNAATLRALRAMRSADPHLPLDADVAPPGHPLLALYVSAGALGPGATAPVQVTGELRVDGVPATAVPVDRPALLQVFGADGAVRATLYRWPEGALPAGVVLAPPAVAEITPTPPTPAQTTLPTETLPEPEPARWPLWVGAGVSLAGSATALILAGRYAEDVRDPSALPDDPEIIQSTYTRNHVAVIAGGGLGVLALGLGVGAAVSVRW